MIAILPVEALCGLDQLQPDFVGQRGGFERMVSSFAPHPLTRHAAQMLIDKLRKKRFGAGFPQSDLPETRRDPVFHLRLAILI